MSSRHSCGRFSGLMLLGAVAFPSQALGQQTTELVSVSSHGNIGIGFSESASISADGRYVAFQSSASNLVPGDTNGTSDVLVHDRQTGITELVSLATSGAQANDYSDIASISDDGRHVAFRSTATNLGALNPGSLNVYVRDREAGITELISIVEPDDHDPAGSGSPSISATGRYVAFLCSASNLVPGDFNEENDVFVRDRQAGITALVSANESGFPGNGYSDLASTGAPVVSADGRYVAFSSSATDLVPDDTNFRHDVFVRDRQTGTNELISVDSAGMQGNGESEHASISDDGRFVVFESIANNLVPGDTNSTSDIFIRDRQTGITERVSVASSGSEGDSSSMHAATSGDGRFVAFTSWAANLVPGDENGLRDVFIRDRQAGLTELLSLDSTGLQGPGSSRDPAITPDGLYVAFDSSSDLGAVGTFGGPDVYVRDRSCSADFVSYCTAGTSASNCAAILGASGIASSSAPSGFVVTATFVEGQKDGLFFFGQNGQQATPWGNGTSYQCVVPPVRRAGLQAGNGSPGACDAIISQDLNALWCPSCPKPSMAPLASQKLQIQFWYRDPFSTSNQPTSLSDAIEVMVCPGS